MIIEKIVFKVYNIKVLAFVNQGEEYLQKAFVKSIFGPSEPSMRQLRKVPTIAVSIL